MDNHGNSEFENDPSSKIRNLITLIESLQKTQHKTIKIIKNGARMTLEMNTNVNGEGNGCLWMYGVGLQWNF